jgi:hypothetical protein
MANFKLTHYYYIYHIQVKLFNSFVNSEDFINTVGALYINDENFFKEIHEFLIDIIKIIENDQKPTSLFYEQINLFYINYERLGIYDSYRDRIKTFELLLKIFSYNDNDDTKFDIFYKKHMANFKLSKYYNISIKSNRKLFNSFINSEDFIYTIINLNTMYYYINFFKEIHEFLTDIIKIIENEEELKNKLNASVISNDILNDIFSQVINSIPEKREEKKEIEPIKTKKKPISATIKRLVWNKWIGEEIGKAKCLCCNLTAITQLSFNAGHIIAESNGGETNVSNLKPICQNCNSSMGTKNMIDFMKTLN